MIVGDYVRVSITCPYIVYRGAVGRIVAYRLGHAKLQIGDDTYQPWIHKRYLIVI